MLNTILALLSMWLPHVEHWVTQDLRVSETEIRSAFNKAAAANIVQRAARLQDRTDKLLRDNDVLLQKVAAHREAQARNAAAKATAELEAEKKRSQERVD